MRKGFPYLFFALTLSLAIACFVERRVFYDPMALNDDVRNQIYWIARLKSPLLFQNDYIANYFAQPLLVSPFLKGLYGLAAVWTDPLFLTQYLPLLLVMVASFFLFKFCERYQGARYAFWVSFAFNASIWIIKNLAGGLPRAFVYPLLFALLWALQEKRWAFVVLVLLMSALIYPPVALLGFALLVVLMVRAYYRSQNWRLYLSVTAASLLAVMGVALYRILTNTPAAGFGGLTTAWLASSMKVMYPGGRVVLFALPYQLEQYQGGGRFGLDLLQRLPQLYILIPVLVFAGGAFFYQKYLKQVLGTLRVLPLVWKMAVAACFMYILAWLCLFYLYVPERYLEYALFIVPSFVVGDLVHQCQRRFPAKTRSIGLGFLFVAILGTGLGWRSDLMMPSQHEKTLYSFLKHLPAPGLIAASPGLASNIPLYSFRSVFLSNEAFIPFHQQYFREVERRFRNWLEAYYATNEQSIQHFVHQYKIRYLILQTTDFEPERLKGLEKRSYHAFETSFFSGLKHPQPADYYLRRLPTHCFIYQQDKFQVIDVQKCWPEVNRVTNR